MTGGHGDHESGRGNRGGRPRGNFYGDRNAEKGQQEKDRHCGKGKIGGKSALSQGKDAEMHELQTLLPYHDGLFGRGGIFGRETFFKL